MDTDDWLASYSTPIYSGYTQPVFITKYVLLGDAEMTRPDILKAFNIKAIVRLAAGYPPPPDVQVLYIPIVDLPSSNIKKYFPQIFKFIDEHVKHGHRVLIHCAAGVSRSATATIAYLMHLYKCSVNEAYEMVKKISPIISPNYGFMQQLSEAEQAIIRS